ncbi:MAG: hypothetical protein KC416_13905 [Myxococcales bacterium]|nr:hypothetical protein [Myxococcales bacterium]
METLTWQQICTRDDYRGRWVALSSCDYDEEGRARGGAVVDVDDDLATLCTRIRTSEWRHCDILFCREHPSTRTSCPDPFRRSSRPPAAPN